MVTLTAASRFALITPNSPDIFLSWLPVVSGLFDILVFVMTLVKFRNVIRTTKAGYAGLARVLLRDGEPLRFPRR